MGQKLFTIGYTSLPVKTRDHRRQFQSPLRSFADEAYQLIRIQFQEVRYPVVETIEDVLRLRHDKNLDRYRSVVLEYSKRLRRELESERPRVLEEFRRDIQLALKGLKGIETWTKAADLAFYISIPLAIAGILCGLPLSDLVAIPVTVAAKLVSHAKRCELDWILFGRP